MKMKNKFTVEVDGPEAEAMYNIMKDYLAKHYTVEKAMAKETSTEVHLALFIRNALEYGRMDGEFSCIKK